MIISKFNIALAFSFASLLVGACGSDDSTDDGEENEVITTVTLTFTPTSGGAATTFIVNDPDGDGGSPPVADTIDIAPGMYTVAVGFENRLETPPEIITTEVSDEAIQHQVFLTGTAVNGPASNQPGAALTHTYSDTDDNGLPVGLANQLVVDGGSGDLTVTLRHLPPNGNTVVKVTSLAADVRTGGFPAIGGTTDAQVTFPVVIAAPGLR